MMHNRVSPDAAIRAGDLVWIPTTLSHAGGHYLPAVQAWGFSLTEEWSRLVLLVLVLLSWISF